MGPRACDLRSHGECDEGGIVRILKRADEALERIPVHADVDPIYAGPSEVRGFPLVVLIGPDDGREVWPVLFVEREEGGAVDRGNRGARKGVADDLDHLVAVGPVWRSFSVHAVKVVSVYRSPNSAPSPGSSVLQRAVNKPEARQLAANIIESLRAETYEALVDRYLNKEELIEVVGKSGTPYSLEVQAFWDSGDPGNLRVMVAIDDGGWRAFSPLTDDFIMAPDSSFVGE